MKRPERILAPVDFSDASLEAVDVAAGMAYAMKAELILLAVSPGPAHDPAYAAAITNRRCVEESLRCLFQDRLRTLVTSAPWPGGEPPRVLVRQGRPAREILGVAREERADLIVMGTHGRRGLARMVLGSVTEEVLRLAPCPVLAVRRPESLAA
jgi:universal stress protein A